MPVVLKVAYIRSIYPVLPSVVVAISSSPSAKETILIGTFFGRSSEDVVFPVLYLTWRYATHWSFPSCLILQSPTLESTSKKCISGTGVVSGVGVRIGAGVVFCWICWRISVCWAT